MSNLDLARTHSAMTRALREVQRLRRTAGQARTHPALTRVALWEAIHSLALLAEQDEPDYAEFARLGGVIHRRAGALAAAAKLPAAQAEATKRGAAHRAAQREAYPHE